MKKGLGGYGTEHVKHIDWVWRSVIKDPNYEWSQPQYVGSGITERVNMGLRRVGGNDKDVHMAAIAVRDGAANKCSFTLGPCGYFRIHKNGEGTGPQVSKIVRNLPVSCLATKRPDTGVEKKIGTLPDLKAK